MALPTPFNPAIQKYFKLSELAGNRWPNVTKNEIYNWHDQGFGPPTGIDENIVENFFERIDFWKDNIHSLQPINALSYWVYFEEFRSFRTKREACREKESGVLLNKHHELFPFESLTDCYFMLDMESTKRLAHKKGRKINCAVLFDEKGKPHCLAEFDEEKSKWHPGQIEVEKEDLLIKGSSVRLIEKTFPEITSKTFQTNKETSGQLQNHPGEKILEGWKDIAAHAKRSISHAKRHYKPVIKYTETGRPVTTTARLDAFRLNTASKKNKK